MQPVEITARDIYTELVRLSERLTVLVEQHKATRADVAAVRRDVADHEHRLRELERGRWPIPAASLLLSLAALAWTILRNTGG